MFHYHWGISRKLFNANLFSMRCRWVGGEGGRGGGGGGGVGVGVGGGIYAKVTVRMLKTSFEKITWRTCVHIFVIFIDDFCSCGSFCVQNIVNTHKLAIFLLAMKMYNVRL